MKCEDCGFLYNGTGRYHYCPRCKSRKVHATCYYIPKYVLYPERIVKEEKWVCTKCGSENTFIESYMKQCKDCGCTKWM